MKTKRIKFNTACGDQLISVGRPSHIARSQPPRVPNLATILYPNLKYDIRLLHHIYRIANLDDLSRVLRSLNCTEKLKMGPEVVLKGQNGLPDCEALLAHYHMSLVVGERCLY